MVWPASGRGAAQPACSVAATAAHHAQPSFPGQVCRGGALRVLQRLFEHLRRRGGPPHRERGNWPKRVVLGAGGGQARAGGKRGHGRPFPSAPAPGSGCHGCSTRAPCRAEMRSSPGTRGEGGQGRRGRTASRPPVQRRNQPRCCPRSPRQGRRPGAAATPPPGPLPLACTTLG